MKHGAAIAALAACLWAAPADAVVLDEDPLSGDSVEIGATARSFNYVMNGDLPGATNGAVSLADLRARAALKRGEWLSLALHDALTMTTSSLSLGASGGALALGQGRLPPTWLPLDWTIEDSSQLTLHDRIDWAYARFTTGGLGVTIGRQPITFGRGALWTPEDLIDPFSPFQIDSEFKPGLDAARLDYALDPHASIALVGVAAHDGGSAAMERLEVSAGAARIGVMSGYVRGDAVGTLDLFVDLHGADLHGEVTGTYVPDENRRPFDRKIFGRAVLGSTFQLSSRLHGTVEAYWNGSGSMHPSDYAAELMSPRLQSGETYNLGVYYGGAVLDFTAHALVHVAAAAIVNVVDESALIAPSIHFNASNNTVLIAGAFIPIGSSPNEFALYPTLYHFDLKAYF